MLKRTLKNLEVNKVGRLDNVLALCILLSAYQHMVLLCSEYKRNYYLSPVEKHAVKKWPESCESWFTPIDWKAVEKEVMSYSGGKFAIERLSKIINTGQSWLLYLETIPSNKDIDSTQLTEIVSILTDFINRPTRVSN